MKNIGKMFIFIILIGILYSCTDKENITKTEVFSNSGETIEMDSSNEGGGNGSGDLLNDSFR